MIGTRLGSYEITAKLGEGGMGEVYRATDSRLKREVAIKVLPAEFTEDSERLARFEREAQLLAQLHHPNIASIFGLEESGGVKALVMELVPGPTLAERLESGPLSIAESLSFALQIAQALEEAHEKGIVHRDLKPQNIKASVEGKAKVLDFGLAKAMDATSGPASAADLARSPTIMNSPTLTAVHGTQLGVILGTAAYMAPEQARGTAVDKRADIWAFGVVLFEMLSGKSLFAGPTVSDTLAGVLKTDIDWRALPAETPPAIRSLLRRCLERNPKNRLHDIADARIVLEEVLSGGAEETSALPAASPAGAARRTPALLLLAGGLAVLALGGLAGFLLSRAPASVESEMRLPLAFPGGWKFADADLPLLAISRDGRRRAIGAANEDGRQAILFADLGEIDWHELPATAGGQAPFFSPDGKWLGYFGEGMLRKISVDGGPPLPVTRTGNQTRGAVWLPDGTIVYSPDAGESLWRIGQDGGEPRRLTTLRKERNERTHRWPDALPDGKVILFTVDSGDTTEYYDDADIEAVVVATGERKTVLRGSSQARYLDPGFLVFARGGSLFVTGFDPRTLETHGTPVPMVQEVATNVSSGATQFAVGGGALLWAPGLASTVGFQPMWIDRQGVRSAPLTDVGTYNQASLSPDGKRLALVSRDGTSTDLWILDFDHRSRSRLTFDGDVTDPTWTPDGKRLAYLRSGAAVGGGSDFYWKLADGSGEAEPLVTGPEVVYAGAFTPDGRFFAYDRIPDAGSSMDIWMLALDATREKRPLQATEAFEYGGTFSPDGRWLAYLVTAAGATELFVRPFPAGAGKWQVSTDGAFEPHWSADGRELFFRRRGTLFRVPVESAGAGGNFVAGAAERIASGFRPGDNVRTYSPAPDGLHFAALPGWEVVQASAQVNLALHWDREVRRRLQSEH